MSPLAPRVVRLEQIEAVPGPGTLIWHPVRLTLGVRAFGCNAYTAGEAGQDLVEPHAEAPKRDHEELYYVAAGRATFTIDGERYDAPAGTYVFVPDPASHRQAVAAEAQTTVLSFGGPPTFEPSAWEWAFLAGPRLRSDPERAREIIDEGLALYPESPSILYTLACLEAVEDHRDAALAALSAAIEQEHDLAAWAREDDDLASLRDDDRFRSLVGAG